jgi:hypothetical protein
MTIRMASTSFFALTGSTAADWPREPALNFCIG